MIFDGAGLDQIFRKTKASIAGIVGKLFSTKAR
jgi:hypothetical protein